jgi:hypothetical protein
VLRFVCAEATSEKNGKKVAGCRADLFTEPQPGPSFPPPRSTHFLSLSLISLPFCSFLVLFSLLFSHITVQPDLPPLHPSQGKKKRSSPPPPKAEGELPAVLDRWCCFLFLSFSHPFISEHTRPSPFHSHSFLAVFFFFFATSTLQHSEGCPICSRTPDARSYWPNGDRLTSLPKKLPLVLFYHLRFGSVF